MIAASLIENQIQLNEVIVKPSNVKDITMSLQHHRKLEIESHLDSIDLESINQKTVTTFSRILDQIFSYRIKNQIGIVFNDLESVMRKYNKDSDCVWFSGHIENKTQSPYLQKFLLKAKAVSSQTSKFSSIMTIKLIV